MLRSAAAALLTAFAVAVLPAAAGAETAAATPEDGSILQAMPELFEVILPDAQWVLLEATLRDIGGGDLYLLEPVPSSDQGTIVMPAPDGLGQGAFELFWRMADADGSESSGSARFAISSEGAPVQLRESFPRAGREVVFPPREARFSFSAPVDASGFTARLITLPEETVEDIQRITSGSASDVLVRVPVIGSGEYRIDWTLVTPDGSQEGSVPFSVATPLTAAGGGNHRHSTDDLFIDSVGSWLPRAALLLLSGLLLGAWRRSRRSGEDFSDLLAVRVSGAALAVFSLVGVASSAIEGLTRSGDYPLFAVLASDAVWVYLASTALGVLVGLAGRPGTPLLWSSLLLAGLVWSVGPSMQFRYGPAVPVLSLLLYGLTVAFASELLLAVRGEAPRWRPVVLVWAAAFASTLLLIATAQTLPLLGEFAADWRWRMPVLAVTAALSLLWLRLRAARGPWSIAVVVLMVVGVALGLWTPPPAPGL